MRRRGTGTVDVLYVARNRLEFTVLSFAALVENTDWGRVRRLVVQDDGSEDGTAAWIDWQAELIGGGIEVEVRHTSFGSPVAVMADYLARGPADWFAKVDNDACVPPGWLDATLGVLDRDPKIDLLGMEAGMTRVVGRGPGYGEEPWDGVYRFEPSTHIGGVGLMRSAAFRGGGRGLRPDGRNGFTEFQHIHRPTRGWITPDLPVPLLDRLPMEPFASLSDRYVAAGWQRPWPRYDPVFMRWAWERVPQLEAICATA